MTGGGVLLAGSWAIVSAAQDIPLFESRLFVGINGLPDGPWPVVWAPMQVGSFGGSLAVCVLLATLSSPPARRAHRLRREPGRGTGRPKG